MTIPEVPPIPSSFLFNGYFLRHLLRHAMYHLCERMESTHSSKNVSVVANLSRTPPFAQRLCNFAHRSCFCASIAYARIPSNRAFPSVIMVILQPIYEYGEAVAANVQRAPLDMTASPPVSVMMIGIREGSTSFVLAGPNHLGFPPCGPLKADHVASSMDWGCIGRGTWNNPFFPGRPPWKNPRK